MMRMLLLLCVCLSAPMFSRAGRDRGFPVGRSLSASKFVRADLDVGYHGFRTCTRTSDCRTGQCCRDRGGNLLGEPIFGGVPLLDPSVSGRCSRRPSRPGQVCNLACGCVRGYTCYRTVTGACCPPRTCWTDEAARKDKEYWDNCASDPNCFFPPVAPPQGK